MIVDYRIYATIYAVGVVAYLAFTAAGMATVDNDRAQYVLTRLLVGTVIVLTLTGLTQYLDWLWS